MEMERARALRGRGKVQARLHEAELPRHILPTNATSHRQAFHRWFGFVPGFSPEYVRKCVYEGGFNQRATVLDPFAGCGTTLVEANALGLRSIGFEPHPFLADICRAKILTALDPEVAETICDALTCPSPQRPSRAFTADAVVFLTKLFPEDSLATLAGARDICLGFKGKYRVLGRLILSRVIDLASHSKTDGIYKAPTSRKAPYDYERGLSEVRSLVVSDLTSARAAAIENQAELHELSSETVGPVPKRSCDIAITSPPYLNNFDFAEMTRMYLYFWGYAGSWREITERVRARLVVNTTTALKGHTKRYEQYRAEMPVAIRPVLDGYRADLQERRQTRAGKKPYEHLVYPYFAQMTRVLRSVGVLLKPGAELRLIVSDAALYGVHIRAHEVLATVLTALDYEGVAIEKLRSRGERWVLEKREGAEDGLGEFELRARAPKTTVYREW